jgi:hypothetical protein
MSGAFLESQKGMATAVMEPLTRNETTRRVRRDGVVMEDEAADFIKPNDSLSSFERLEIYNRQYWFRLYSSFEEDFPGLQAALGRRHFDRVMRAYLDACPSISFTLRDLSSRLHSWLTKLIFGAGMFSVGKLIGKWTFNKRWGVNVGHP